MASKVVEEYNKGKWDDEIWEYVYLTGIQFFAGRI